ncbi:MAG: hypothetical protein JST84_04725 [Acidobacteria bacterium]|nr:hypothetical protein [Acidobacteriota bacterium]
MNPINNALLIGQAWLTIAPAHACSYASWVLQHDPLNTEAYTLLYESLLRMNKQEMAALAIETIIDWITPAAARQIAAVHKSLLPAPLTAAQHLLQSVAFNVDGQAELARLHCEEAVKLRPDWYLGYLQLGLLTRTTRHLRRSLDLAPQEFRGKCFTALCQQLREEENWEALRDLFIASDPTPEYLVQKTIFELHISPATAFTSLDSQLLLLPVNSRFSVCIALHEQTLNAPNASLVWEYLSRETPYWGSPLESLASYYIVHNQFPKAQNIMERMVRMKPEKWQYHVSLAILTHKEEGFLQAIGLAPDQEPGAVIPYAQYLAGLGRFHEAINLLIPCVEANPQHEFAAQLLTVCGRKACDEVLL